MKQILSGMPETNSVFAEYAAQGFHRNVGVNRPVAARYRLTKAVLAQSDRPPQPHTTLVGDVYTSVTWST